MTIGYVKIRQVDIGIKNLIKYYFYRIFNIVKQEGNIYNITNNNTKNKCKLIKLLKKNNIDYIITEGNVKIDYPTISGELVIKYFIPEIVEYCMKIIDLKIDEIYVCSNKFTKENCELIEELSKKTKVVNILTENSQYNMLEKELESKELYITVSANKRKSLKKAYIVINLDFNSFKDCNINRNMLLIDVNKNTQIPKAFQGILIKNVEIDTKKVMRVFSEFENFDRSKLIQAEILKLNKYMEKREFIRKNKIFFFNLKNNKIIHNEDFDRIKKLCKSKL